MMDSSEKPRVRDGEVVAEKTSVTTESKQPGTGGNETDASDVVYPTRAKLLLIIGATALAIFLVALDTTIVSTAIPRITDDFHSLQDVGWYGSGYFMTLAAFQIVWGKAYKFWTIRPVYLLAIFIFEVGSLICALAPNSPSLIVGRAIAGVGAGGIASGSYLIVGLSVPPSKAPALQGVTGASFAIASVVGPLLGGAFTTYATWRWCFYVNLPLGAVTIVLILFFYRIPAHMRPEPTSLREKLTAMDPLGTTLLLSAFTCLFLALQKGGITQPWSSADVIGTLAGAGVLSGAFVLTEYLLGERAAIQSRFLRDKTMAYQFTFQTLVAGSFFVLLYYLPIYFQVVSNVSAAQSGVRTIPLVAFGSVMVICVGIWLSVTGEYQAAMLIGSVFTTVGSGLLYKLAPGSRAGAWIGYQIIGGIGLGTTVQLAVMVCQGFTVLQDMSAVSALTLFFQLTGGAVWISVSQSIFTNTLVRSLTRRIEGVSPAVVVAAGATELRQVLPPSQVSLGVDSYMDGLRNAYILSVALGGTAFILALVSVFHDRRTLEVGRDTLVAE